MKRRHLRTTAIMPCLLGAAFVIFAVYRIIQPSLIVGPSSTVHFDDWFFGATNAQRVDSIGAVSPGPGNSFYIVNITVTSEAKRVEFTFHPESIRVTLDDQTLQPSARAQSALAPLPSMVIPPGGRASFLLAFVGPSNGVELKVKFETGGIGELLDALLGENEQIRFRIGIRR